MMEPDNVILTISVDDRPFARRKRSALLIGTVFVILASSLFAFVMVWWEPLRTGDYPTPSRLLLLSLMGFVLGVVVFWLFWAILLTEWINDSRLSVFADTACGDLVLHTTRHFGYRRVARIPLTDV